MVSRNLAAQHGMQPRPASLAFGSRAADAHVRQQKNLSPRTYMDERKKEIQTRLQELEQEERVCIFYACESGSRAWGFPSADSDYDVRFLYIHPQNWYLGIDVKRDVIERPSNDLIDLSG